MGRVVHCKGVGVDVPRPHGHARRLNGTHQVPGLPQERLEAFGRGGHGMTDDVVGMWPTGALLLQQNVGMENDPDSNSSAEREAG